MARKVMSTLHARRIHCSAISFETSVNGSAYEYTLFIFSLKLPLRIGVLLQTLQYKRRFHLGNFKMQNLLVALTS